MKYNEEAIDYRSAWLALKSYLLGGAQGFDAKQVRSLLDHMAYLETIFLQNGRIIEFRAKGSCRG